MKKRKIEQDPNGMTPDSLIKMAREAHDKIMNKAAAQEAEIKKELSALATEEGKLVIELENGQKLLDEMIEDFEIAEREKKTKALKAIESQAISEADVKSGKSTMNEFIEAGKKADEIQREASQKIEEELEKASSVIRSKAAENKQIEISLCSARVKIHNLMIAPVRLLQQNFREIDSILSFQFEKLSAEHIGSHDRKKQLESELMNVAGHSWQDIDLKSAYRLQFDSVILPEYVPDLLEKLSQFGEGDRVSITFYGEGSVHPHGRLLVRQEG